MSNGVNVTRTDAHGSTKGVPSGWQPIETAPRDLVQGADDPILIAHIDPRGQIIWACAAMWISVPYGYVQCAQRSGWHADFFPPMAHDWRPPKPSGEWIVPTKGLEPTHWMPLPAPPEITP